MATAAMNLTPGDPFFDLLLLFLGYFIAIFSRFRIIIYILNTLVFIVRGYQWVTRNRTEVDERIAQYVYSLRHAESLIFPVVFAPFRRRKKTPRGITHE
jgi:hypothetical protein